MHIYIKNMVCNRCILVVKQLLTGLNLPIESVELGEVKLTKAATEKQLRQLNEQLKSVGFELLDNQKQQLIEKIKNLLIKKVQEGEMQEHFVLSEFLDSALKKDYSAASRLFSEVEGSTVEQFFIMQKIEKVKEWLVYGELNLSEISYKLGYSSVAHLSAQFKKITGLTPSYFKQMGEKKRKPLDKIAS